MRTLGAILLLTISLYAGEDDAARITSELLNRHLPYGAILDPIFPAPDSMDIVSYTRCGDSALWTGAWLAAESYHYAVTNDPAALTNVRNAIDAIRKMIDVTGTGVLARCTFPADSPFAADLAGQEAANVVYNGIVDGQPWRWVGNTSRDQYIGVFFGLTTAYDLTGDEAIRGSVNALATRMVENLQSNGWFIRLPDGAFSTTFLNRPDQQLALLKLVRRTHPARFLWPYRFLSAALAPQTLAPISIDVLDVRSSYFKFNLDHMTFYMLRTGGDSDWVTANYQQAFDILRRTTDGHDNAFFDLIDRAVNGPAADRDARIRRLLDEWLQRPRRDFFVDLRGVYPACGDQACDPIPVPERVTVDFVWQVNPFQSYGSGSGRIENPGLDYLLPYWMARYYGVL